MADILIHAGNLKTGSTAIQAVLMRMRPALAERGLVMPNLGPRQAAHYKVAREWRPNEEAPVGGAVAEMLETLRRADPGTVPLLTSETFMNADPSRVHDLIAQLPGRRPRLLFYMRPHAGLLASLYLQLVKIGKFSDPVASVAPQMTRLPAIQFISVVEAFAEVFGQDAITVREFSRETLASGSIVADFWDAFGLPADLLGQALATETVSNPTPTLEMSILLRALRLHLMRHEPADAPEDSLRRPVLAFFKAMGRVNLPGQAFRLPLALQEELAEQWEGPRAAFARRWFRLPATAAWLQEGMAAPVKPQPLPFAPLEAAAADTAQRLQKRMLPRHARRVVNFVQKLPGGTQGGERMIDIAALDSLIAANGEDGPAPKPGARTRGTRHSKKAAMPSKQEA